MIDTTKSLSGVSYNGSPIPFEIPERGEYHVQAIDYDGTVIKEDWLNTGDVFELPAYPVHTGLTAQEWSSPQVITNNTITVEDMDVTVGVVYTTASGLSEFDIELTSETGLEVTLNVTGGTSVNWGDGTTDANTTHTYASAGFYTISTDHTTINTSSTAGLFGQTTSNKNKFLKRVRIGSNLKGAPNYAYAGCSCLESITIPKSNDITSLGYKCFSDCYSLKCLVCSSKLFSFAEYCLYNCYYLEYIVLSRENVQQFAFNSNSFSNCYNLKEFHMPKLASFIPNCLNNAGIKNAKIGTTAKYNNGSVGTLYKLEKLILAYNSKIGTSSSGFFGGNYFLKELTLPSNLTAIGASIFNNSYSLSKVVFPSTITSIGAQAFSNCYSCLIYDFSSVNSIPSLANINAFTNINAITKIIVPDSLYEDWITTSNWVTYAEYIVKASDVE